ncbi:MAG TPA: DEAD/DEAH box helicase [Thermoanaerobaculia bacterium]|jgi:superfamily II DNA or RNA helicase|nr:DEAD/DEAH box helicase [Thermoanaerobaculia bacterium]
MPPFTHLEFHRYGIGLVPEGRGAETAIYVEVVPGSSKPLRSCTCAASRKKTCDHLKDLSRAVAEVQKTSSVLVWEAKFTASVWHRLAKLFYEGDQQAAAKVRVQRIEDAGKHLVRVTSPAGQELALYLEDSAAQLRFLERTGKVAGEGVFDRAGLLERLALFQATPDERAFAKAGMRTHRQAWEESFWHRLAYHCTREYGTNGAKSGTFHPSIDQESGRFTLTYRQADAAPSGHPVVQVTVPRDRVRAALRLLAEIYPEQEDLAIRPIPLQSILHMSEETELDLIAVRPMLRAIQASGEARLFSQEDLQKFRYGNLVWLKELNLLAELEKEGQERKFHAPARLTLARSQVPGFLAAHGADLGAGTLVLDEPLQRRRIFKTYDRLAVASLDLEDAMERSWYWLAVDYGFGSQSISLARLLEAKREGLPYLEVAGGWIDLNAPAFRPLDDLLAEETKEREEQVRFSAGELLRFQALAEQPLELSAPAGTTGADILERLLHLAPAAPFVAPPGLATPLRPYQQTGVDWLRFLAENRLAGLLCDDMGLGKTLQTMALMISLLDEGGGEPFLVACPTSVVSHWRDQLHKHAPGLNPVVYHGPQRKLPLRLRPKDVVVTSYGVLRRDGEALSAIPFRLAVFDEIQQVKNRMTQAWQSASHLIAQVKIGLTGTPIENSLADLKTLFDLILPGYLGTDHAFEERFGNFGEKQGPDQRLRDLRRVISPFVLRRLKTSVLDELPAKIEDTRTCPLSDDQVKLYRDAVDGKGAELAAALQKADEPLPYIHVFALLNLLKQICDHPVLALGDLDRAEEYSSGKWDLYQELLQEALESGQKVVVFTQFLGMITLMQRQLQRIGVGHVTLTGASTNRGQLVDRFNRDPACRVFLGSLKAGGTGIDLVGGSVVIHYDRWWNAAREDQATDRVYRIGQKRAVQVFKLVTEGTLEEKIAAIIDRKRQMMASVVAEDDPKLAKIFSREELLEMLRGV